MASKFFFLIFSCFIFVGTPQTLDELTKTYTDTLSETGGDVAGLLASAEQNINGSGGGLGVGPDMQCVQKLLPCQPYLHATAQPPATCCVPLTDMISNQKQCLCGVINNPQILQSLNVTKDDALNLVKSCGATPDISVCKTAISPASPPTPAAPSISSSSKSPPSNEQTTSAAYQISYFNGGLIVSFVVALAVSAY